jgi:hypothetical protein
MCYSQQKSDSTTLSKDQIYAQKEIAAALLKPGICFLNDTLFTDKETAIKFAELILFKVYGEGQTIYERPYKVYNSRGYWYIDGTVHEEKGGAFEIIFNSVDGQIIRLCHGK